MKLAVTILLLPAALATPSNYGFREGYSHSHKSGNHHLPSGISGGPFGPSNSSALPTGSSAGSAGDTVTVTDFDYVTVTEGGAAELATSSAAQIQPIATPSSTPDVANSVSPSSQTAVVNAEKAAPSSKAQSSTPVNAASAASPVAQSAVASSASPVAQSAAASSSSVAPASSQNQSTSNPGGKRGLFITVSTDGTTQKYVDAFNAHPGKITWIVNQFSAPPDAQPGLSDHFEYVPQCYDFLSDNKNEWTTNAQNAVQKQSQYFLSFGEPNTNTTSPKNPQLYQNFQQGANNFIKLLQPYAVNNGIKIGSPGTLGAPDDIGWQRNFLGACATAGCKIDFVACHWIVRSCDSPIPDVIQAFWGTVNNYIQIAKDFSPKYGKDLKVWIDNFGGLYKCPSAKQQQFLDSVLPDLDSNPWIERYAFLAQSHYTDPNGFLNSDGSMSDLGKFYADR